MGRSTHDSSSRNDAPDWHRADDLKEKERIAGLTGHR
jgi:hypothetical protein